MKPQRRLAAKALCLSFLISGLAPGFLYPGGSRAWAQDGQPGPTEVITYDKQEFGGKSKLWVLPDGQPYLYVPYIGDDARGKISSLKAGAGVGVMLFQRPFFAAKDDVCAPPVGSDARPDLKWRGITASFVPDPAALSTAPVAMAKLARQRFSSMIVYRKDLGPPPGVLLLDRRTFSNWSCKTPTHTTYYNRIFVPVPEKEKRSTCFNLTPSGSKKPILTADRLLLMMPADLDDRYLGVDHKMTATVYDAPDCNGDSVSFSNIGQPERDFTLGHFDFRNRPRSVLIVYGNGALDRYLPAPSASDEALMVRMQKQAEPVPEPEPETKTAPETEPAATTPDTTQLVKQAPVAESEPAVPARQAAPAPEEPPVSATPPASAPGSAPQVASALGTKFEFPVFDVYRLNYCLAGDKGCGEEAATAWCKIQGFKRASEWRIDKNIGGLFPTINIGNKKICARYLCSGFEEITCAP